MASITVPTERSAHYGLRPPPAGSPTMGAGATAARPPDSVFVHARQAQLAQQAVMAQQQQQQVRRSIHLLACIRLVFREAQFSIRAGSIMFVFWIAC